MARLCYVVALLFAERAATFGGQTRRSMRMRPLKEATTPPEGKLKMPVGQVGSDKFQLVYTCNQCDARNVVAISRIAWTEGVVIAKCRGCPARHLLADNTGLTDTTNNVGFKNIVEELASKGEAATYLNVSDAESMRKLGVELVGDDISLVPSQSERVEAQNPNKTRVMGTSKIEPLIIEKSDDVEEIVVVDDKEPVVVEEEEVQEAAFVVDLPEGPAPGDVLRVLYGDSFLRVVVPEGATSGSRLVVGGAVEVRVPLGLGPGEVLSIQLPDGTYVAVDLVDDETEGELVKVGFPVGLQKKA